MVKETLGLLLFQIQFFRLHPASIATIAEFTLAFLITLYFLSLKSKTRDTWLMIGFVALAMCVFLVDVGVTSSRPPIYYYFRVSHLIFLSGWTIFATWCAYTYQSNTQNAEKYWVVIIETIILGAAVADLMLETLPVIGFQNVASAYYMIIGMQAWSAFVLWRRARIAAKKIESSTASNRADLVNPNVVSWKSLQALSFLFFSWFAIILITLLLGSTFTYHIGQMVLLLGALVVHLSYAREETTLQIKLVSLPLATTLALLGILPFLLFGVRPPESAWEGTDPKQQDQLRTFALVIPGSTAFILVAFVFFYRNGLLKPLKNLLNGVRAIQTGDLDAQVAVYTKDEIGYFANNLNIMAGALKASREELENRVTERTEKLQASLLQLQATQAQLIQSEKMASLGELTAGIAHEIQNPLNFVNNFSELNVELLNDLQLEVSNGNLSEVKKIVTDLAENEVKIHQHGKRAENIVKGMLLHSRTGNAQKEPTDINRIAQEYLQLSYHGLRAKDKSFNAIIKADFDDTIGKLNIIQQDIGRMFINLFNNAFYSVLQKTKKNGVGYEPMIWITTKKLPGKILITVKDNGLGISPKVLDKIFQPFFTTKPAGHGTGLGLSLTYEIVTKMHGGQIKVETVEGEGAEFIIELPLDRGKV